MKRTLAILISMLAMLLFASTLVHYYPQATDHAPQLTTTSHPVLWVTSDTHFIAPSLHDQHRAWQNIEGTAAGKDMDDQPVALKAFVAAALKARPTAVVITGDVTFNGELSSAKSIARRLAPLTKAGIHLLVIPGNHDIYDGWARQYKGNRQLQTTQISPDDWRQIFHDGYANETSEDADSLSYAVNLNHDYQLLMLDDNIYTVQPATIQPTTGGRLRSSTLSWLRQQLVKAHRDGRQTLVFMHHNLYDHNQHAEGWTLENAGALRKLLADYRVPVVFSGHIHAQDITADPDGRYATKEITSASFTETPGIYGVVDLTPHHLAYHTVAQDLTPVLSAAQKKTPLAHYQRHLKHLFIDDQALPIVWQEAKDAGLQGADLRNAATFLAELNWRFFSGNDSGSPAALQQMPGYRAVMGNAHLRRRAQALLQDKNLPDHQLNLNY